jgi:hypothetical protein
VQWAHGGIMARNSLISMGAIGAWALYICMEAALHCFQQVQIAGFIHHHQMHWR